MSKKTKGRLSYNKNVSKEEKRDNILSSSLKINPVNKDKGEREFLDFSKDPKVNYIYKNQLLGMIITPSFLPDFETWKFEDLEILRNVMSSRFSETIYKVGITNVSDQSFAIL